MANYFISYEATLLDKSDNSVATIIDNIEMSSEVFTCIEDIKEIEYLIKSEAQKSFSLDVVDVRVIFYREFSERVTH